MKRTGIYSDYLQPDVWSSGGVIIRKNNNEFEVILCERFSEKLIALPKGKPNTGEDIKTTTDRAISIDGDAGTVVIHEEE